MFSLVDNILFALGRLSRALDELKKKFSCFYFFTELLIIYYDEPIIAATP